MRRKRRLPLRHISFAEKWTGRHELGGKWKLYLRCGHSVIRQWYDPSLAIQTHCARIGCVPCYEAGHRDHDPLGGQDPWSSASVTTTTYDLAP